MKVFILISLLCVLAAMCFSFYAMVQSWRTEQEQKKMEKWMKEFGNNDTDLR